MRPPLEGGGDALRVTNDLHTGGEVARHVQTQLTNSLDIRSAHQFFQPSGGEAHLPSFAGFSGGSEHAAVHAAMKVGEQTAMAAAQHAGSQAISPIIQMIMRMPGHLGLVTSFFEALSHFFAPAQDMLSNLFDHSLLAAHAEGALNSASAVGDHLDIDMSLLPGDAPIFDMDGGLGDSLGSGSDLAGGGDLASNDYSPFSTVEDNALAADDAMNVNGFMDVSNPQFEQSASSLTGSGMDHMPTDQQYLAWDNTSATFHPQFGNSNALPQTPDPSQMQMQQPLQMQQPAAMQQMAPAQGADASQLPQAPTDAAARGDLINDGQPHAAQDGTQVAQQGDGQAEAPVEYTVKPGDNLWDIARHHFGDGSRWTEIYHANTEVIGADPRLIHPGATLQLPGSDTIASGDYTVQPGDNLWDISRHHLGGGEHWPDLYHANEGVVGSNPDLIHPGQHLSLNGQGGEQIASADAGHHAAATHTAHHATHHASHAQTHVAHSGTSHGAHAADHAADNKVADASSHQKIAHATQPHSAQTAQVEGSQQVPQALAHSPGGAETGMHAQQMSLDQSQLQAEQPQLDTPNK